MILSFLFIFIVDRHFAVPLILAEYYGIINVFRVNTLQLFLEFTPLFLIIIGQIAFLTFGFKKVIKIKSLILLSSPIPIIIGLLLIFDTLTNNHKISSLKTMIPFSVFCIIFYCYSFIKLRNITT